MAGRINADFSQNGNSVFENVYIYGELDYQFDTIQGEKLIINKESWFGGIATFKDDVIIEGNLYLDYLTVNKEFDVGLGGTVFTANADDYGSYVGVGTTGPVQKFQVGFGTQGFVVSAGGTVGIGTTDPYGGWTVGNDEFSDADEGPLKLDVAGSAHISRNLYDRVGSPGQNNYWLKRDELGIRWQPIPPSANQQGIKVQDEGEYIPLAGIAQTFDTLNFKQGNSLGVGTDTLIPTTTPPAWNEAISNRSGTITSGTNVVSISTAGIILGQIIIPDIADPTTVLDANTGITSIGVGTIALSNDNKSGTQTINFDIGVYAYSGIASITTFDLWGFDGKGTDASIYRLTSVGIGTSIPADNVGLHVVSAGTTGVAGIFTGSSTNILVGISQTGIGTALDVVGHTELNQSLNVGGGATFKDNVTITNDNKLFTIQIEDGTDKFTVATQTGNTNIQGTLDVVGEAEFQDNIILDSDNKQFIIRKNDGTDKFTIESATGNAHGRGTLDIDGAANFNLITDASNSSTGGSVTIDGGASVAKRLFIGGNTKIESTTDATGAASVAALQVVGGTAIGKKLYVGSALDASSTTVAGVVITGGVGIGKKLLVGSTDDSLNLDTGAFQVAGGAAIKKNLNVGGGATVGGATTLHGLLELDSSLIDQNNDDGVGAAQTDYRLASVGTGVSWRPAGVQTKNTIWVSIDGIDTNSGLLEGDAKRTIGGAAAIAETGDTILVRSGVYYENNPVGLRTEVTVSGEDLRLVTVVPNNTSKDVFQVRAGCLIQNLNFAGQSSSTNHVGCGAVAFPPTSAGVSGGSDYQAVTGYTALGPANQGPDRIDPSKGGRYRSPYVRNCTNFMTGSIGMKINGDYVNAAFTGTNDLGQDLKSMVCDSFTQYNEMGIGVSLTNNAYAQLVSIFTIGCDIAIFAGTGGQCDLTNSNSSFGNFGLYSDGVGDVEFIATTDTSSIAGQDTFVLDGVRDVALNPRKPFDGQGGYFHINMDDYPDSPASGIVTQPLNFIRSLDVVDGGTGYNEGAPPNVTIQAPQGPEAILPEFSANVSAAGSITSIDVIASGRNFLPDQELTVTFSSGNATAVVNTDPILFTVDTATDVTNSGLSTVTFNEFVPYNVGAAVTTEFVRLSRIITSSHSFEYVGAGTDLNKANPFQGGEPIPENEIVAINGGQVPFTSTDQKGNFRIGDGLTIDQTTSTIRGRDFNRAIQAQLTPLILALR